MQLCFAALPQNEVKSDVARFTTHYQTCQHPESLQDGFDVGGKTLNMAIFRTRFPAMLRDKLHVFCYPFFCKISLIKTVVIHFLSSDEFYKL